MAEFFIDELIPLRDQLIVQLVLKPRMRGSLYLPHEDNAEEHIGKILAVGQDVKDERLKPGVYIMFESYAGREVDVNGRKSRIIEEIHTISIINTTKTKFEDEK